MVLWNQFVGTDWTDSASLKPLDASTKSFLAKNRQDISLQMAHHHHFHPCSQVQPTTPRYSTFRRQWLQLQKWSNLVAGGYGPSQPVTPMPRNLDWFSPQRCFSEINPWLVLITLPTLKAQTKLKAETVPKRVWVLFCLIWLLDFNSSFLSCLKFRNY